MLRGVLAMLLLLPLTVSAEGKKYALLVGVNAYDHGKLPKLDYAVNDADELAAMLKKHGYEVAVLTDTTPTKPTKKNVEAALDDILRKYKKDDTLSVVGIFDGSAFTKQVIAEGQAIREADRQAAAEGRFE